MNIWLFFGAVLLGALIGMIVANWFNRVALDAGQKKMMKDGELFIRVKGKWHPRDPSKPETGRVMTGMSINERGANREKK